ncbi:MAG: hypothetical protein ACK4YO_03630 [Candidatus Altarchaeaceae archaeon]
MLFLVPLISFIYFFAVLSKGSLADTINWFIASFIVFRKSSTISSTVYQPEHILEIYGIIGIVLCIIGIIYLLYRMYAKKSFANMDLIIVGAIVGSINLILFHFSSPSTFLLHSFASISKIFGVNLIIAALMMSVCIGRISRLMALSSGLICVIIVFILVFDNYSDGEKKIYKMISDENYEAIKWIGVPKGTGNVILARQEVSIAICP